MSLTKCLNVAKKEGRAISDADVAEIKNIRQEYLDDGVSPANASILAVQDMLDQAYAERAQIADRLRKKGAAVEDLGPYDFEADIATGTEVALAKEPDGTKEDSTWRERVRHRGNKLPSSVATSELHKILADEKVDFTAEGMYEVKQGILEGWRDRMQGKKPAVKKTKHGSPRNIGYSWGYHQMEAPKAQKPVAKKKKGSKRAAAKPSTRFYRLSPTAPPSTGYNKSVLDKIVDRIAGKWKNAPPIHVVQHESELPEAARDKIKRDKAQGQVRGIYHDGAAYLIADNLENGQDAVETLVHEVVGHYGLRSILGKKFIPVLNQVYAAFGRNHPAMQAIARAYNLDLDRTDHRLEAAEEMIAHMAQTREKPRLLARVVAMLREWMRSVGIDIEMSEKDVWALIAKSARFIENGSMVRGGAQEGTRFSAVKARKQGRKSLHKHGLPKKGAVKNYDVAGALQTMHRKKYGTIAPDDHSPGAMRKIARWITDEIRFEMQHPEDSGLGWYSEKVPESVTMFGELYPELIEDEDARGMFIAFLAIQSDGAKLHNNMFYANKSYREFRANGKASEHVDYGSDRAASIRTNLRNINRLYEEMGAKGMREFLLQEKTGTELNKIAQERGMKFTSPYKVDRVMPMATLVFGPKIGAFYANMMGLHGYLTMDRWWSRSFNRYRGIIQAIPTESSVAGLKEMLGDPSMEFEEMIIRAAPIAQRYKDRKFEGKGFFTELEVLMRGKVPTKKVPAQKWHAKAKKKFPNYDQLLSDMELEKRANSVYKTATSGMNDAPFNKSDREFMIETVAHAQKNLKRSGIDLLTSDIQAALWYFEKRLYAEMGARKSADVDFVATARRIIDDIKAGVAAPHGKGGKTIEGPGGVLLELEEDEPVRFHRRQIRTDAFKQFFKKSAIVDSKGEPMVVYHGTRHDIEIFDNPLADFDNDFGYHFGTQAAANQRVANRRGASPYSVEYGHITAEDRRNNSPKGYYISSDRRRAWNNQYFDTELEAETVAAALHEAETSARPVNDKTEHDGWNVMPVYLSIQNPLVVEWDTGFGWAHIFMHYLQDYNPDVFARLPEKVKAIWYDDRARGEDDQLSMRDIRKGLQSIGYDGITYRNNVEDPGSWSHIAFERNQIKSALGNVGSFDTTTNNIRYARGDAKDIKKAFSKSKVRDDNGNLLRVFRGEHGNYTSDPFFNSNLPSLTFTPDKYVAQSYAAGNGRELGRVGFFYLNVERPFDMLEGQSADNYEDIVSKGRLKEMLGPLNEEEQRLFDEMLRGTYEWRNEDNGYEWHGKPDMDDSLWTWSFEVVDHPSFTELLKRKGYDGVRLYGPFSAESDFDPENVDGALEWRAFSPEQVGSAIVGKTAEEIVSDQLREVPLYKQGIPRLGEERDVRLVQRAEGILADKSHPKGVHAYITRMHAKDFLELTTGETRTPQTIKDEVESVFWRDTFDADKVRAVEGTPFLDVDRDTGKVIGHEGRHRIAGAALKHGDNVMFPVVIDFRHKSLEKHFGEDVPHELYGQFKDSVARTPKNMVAIEQGVTQPEDIARVLRGDHWDDVRYSLKGHINTSEFRQFFRDSKVVDRDGNPKVVYHGTLSDFFKFDKEKGNAGNFVGRAFYFSTSPDDTGINYSHPQGTDVVHRRGEMEERLTIGLRDLVDEGALYEDLMSELEKFAQAYGVPFRQEEFEKTFPEDEFEDGVTRVSKIAETVVNWLVEDQHDGFTMPVYLSIQNPLDLDNDYFDHELDYNIEDYMEDAKEDLEEEWETAPEDKPEDQEDIDAAIREKAFDLALDFNYDPEETGSLAEYLNAVTEVLSSNDQYELAQAYRDEIMELYVNDFGGDHTQVRVSDLLMATMHSEALFDLLNYGAEDLSVPNALDKRLTAAEVFQGALEIMGYDGVKMDASRFVMPGTAGTDHWIAFHPTQIKSVWNEGTWDTSNPDIRKHQGDLDIRKHLTPSRLPSRQASGILDGARAWLRKKSRELRFNFVDDGAYLVDLQKEIELRQGPLQESKDVALAKTLYPGKVRAAVDRFHDDYFEPLLDLIEKSQHSMAEVEDYLHARHAKEANADLKKRNPKRKDNDALSGMTDAEADTILAKYHGDAAMQAVGKMVDDMNDAKLKLAIESGLIKKETVDEWKSRYKHYVPLHRDEVAGSVLPPSGRGLSSGAKLSKVRAGSDKQVSNILPYLVAQAEQVVVLSEKSRVGRALHELVQANPNDDFWVLDEKPKVASLRSNPEYKALMKKRQKVLNDRKLSTLERDKKLADLDDEIASIGAKLVRMNNDPTAQTRENVFVYKINGENHTVTFNPNNEAAMKIASALNKLSSRDMNGFVQLLSKTNRFLSNINTTLNPEFVITNFFRDVQTANYNLTDTEARGMQRRMTADVPKAMKGLFQYYFKKDKSSEWAKYVQEYRDAGGQVAWLNAYDDIEDRRKALIRRLKEDTGGSLWKAEKGIRSVIQAVEDMNMVVENAVRLSAFVNARKAGISEAKAAKISRELTVDFNRKGAHGPLMNALYLFFNASVQGNARLLRAMLSKGSNARKMAVATITFALVLDMYNRAAGGDDDEGNSIYDLQVGEATKERNLVFMHEGEPILIPLPWGYNVLHTVGRVISESLTKPTAKPTEGAAKILASITGAFNPMGSDATFGQFLSPTLGDPILQIAENTSAFGTPVMPENRFKVQPDHMRHWSTARESSVKVARMLSEVTGGNDAKPGGIEVSPESIDLWVDFATGGIGRLVSNTWDSIEKGDKREASRIPFARKIAPGASDRELQTGFYDRFDQIRLLEDQLRTYRDDRDMVRQIREENRELYPLRVLAKSTEKRVKALNKQRRRLKAAGDDARLEQVEAELHQIYRRFVARFDRAVAAH